MKGRICHLGHAQSIHVQKWVNYFAENNWDVHLITYSVVDEKKFDPGIKIHIIPNLKYTQSLFALPRAFFYMVKLSRLIKDIEPDLIHAHEIPSWGVYLGLYRAINSEIPGIITPWGFSHIRTSRGLQKRLEMSALNRVDLILVQSIGLKNTLKEAFDLDENRFITFHWGVNTKMFKPGYEKEVNALRERFNLGKGSFIILSQRILDPYYNIDVIVESAKSVVEKYPYSYFIFLNPTGDKAYLKALKERSVDLGIADNLIFFNSGVPIEKMPVYLNLADVSVMIPKTDQSSFSLLEAMASGPVPIATELAANREWIRDNENGLLVPHDNPRILAKKIIQCIENPELKNKFFDINRGLIEKNGSWFRSAKRMENIYLDLIKTKREN